jgi:hypothetical protein
LLLERDNGWLGPKDILAEVERRRQAFPELKHVDEIWIADTASFEEKGRYVAFGYSGPSGVDSWTFEFYDGSLLMASKNGMAVPADLPTHTPPLGRAAPPLPPLND